MSPRKQRPERIRPVYQDPEPRASFRPVVEENRKRAEVSNAERNAKAQEKGRGSLSVFIVAIESGETIPRKPVSSKGGHRVAEPSLEPRMGH